MPTERTYARSHPPRWPVLKPAGTGQDSRAIRVNRVSCLVGARSRVHLPLNSPMVSRSHALIVVDSGEVYVRDLASSNRLFVNGWAVRETPLQAADLIQIGPFKFRCSWGFSPSSQRGPQAIRARLAGSWGRSHLVDGRTFLIGRREDCDLALRQPELSRVHAVLFRRDGKHFVRDLNSRAGTFVNGRRVRECELSDGDEVRFAATAFSYELLETIGRQNGAGEATLAESWCDSATFASASAMFSATRIGEQTSNSILVEGIAACGSDAPGFVQIAEPEDFGFGRDETAPGPAGPDSGWDGAVANAAELFPPEISLPGVSDLAPPRQENEPIDPFGSEKLDPFGNEN